jgi:DNA-binding NarL/FixJ family response regulator
MTTTPVAPPPAAAAEQTARVSVAIVAADPFAARRIGAALQPHGATTRTATSAEELLDGMHGPHPDAVVLACDPFEAPSLAAIRGIAGALRTSPLVVVSSAPDDSGVQQAINAGADGLVNEAELESTLWAATQAVLVGHISLPRRLHRCVVKPVFSHREKEILAMVVQGLGNKQIADQVFLAESTVKSHLSTAFQKLGVRSRKEAAALLMDPDEGLDSLLDLSPVALAGSATGELGR